MEYTEEASLDRFRPLLPEQITGQCPSPLKMKIIKKIKIKTGKILTKIV